MPNYRRVFTASTSQQQVSPEAQRSLLKGGSPHPDMILSNKMDLRAPKASDNFYLLFPVHEMQQQQLSDFQVTHQKYRSSFPPLLLKFFHASLAAHSISDEMFL